MEKEGGVIIYMHKLKHYMAWVCTERAPRLVKVELRREFSSNIYHLPTIDEREDPERVDDRCFNGGYYYFCQRGHNSLFTRCLSGFALH